ncbi:MAG: hypothetical protein WCI97_04625 [Bacteroidota bacterium]
MKNAIAFVLLLATTQLHATGITFSEALKQNLISVTVTGIDYKSDSVYVSSFYGPCINLRVKNISKILVNLYEAPGRLLMPDDTDQQTIMMSEVIAISLEPGQEVKKKIHGFCTEAHDAAPNMNTQFTFGSLASANLFNLSKLLSDKKLYDFTAQQAVWCLSNDQDPEFIYSDDDTASASVLRKFVCKVKGVPYTSTPRVNKESPRLRYIEGQFDYTIQKPKTISLKVYNQSGQLVKNIVDGLLQPAGDYTYKYDFTMPLNDPSQPDQFIVVKFYINGELLSNSKHVLTQAH